MPIQLNGLKTNILQMYHFYNEQKIVQQNNCHQTAFFFTTVLYPCILLYCKNKGLTAAGVWVQKKVSDLHRTATTCYRCFDQDLAEFTGSWSCRTYPMQRYDFFL